MSGYVNSAYAVSVTVQNSEGTAYDLTNADLGMRFFRPSPSHKTPLDITTGSGITVTDPASGIFTINLTPAQTKELGVGSIRVELFKFYSNDTTRVMLAEGSEVFEGARFDA